MTGEAWLSEMKRVDSLSKEQIKRLQPQADKQDADFRRDYLLMPDSKKDGAISRYTHRNGLFQALFMVEYHIRVLEVVEDQGFVLPLQAFAIFMEIIGSNDKLDEKRD